MFHCTNKRCISFPTYSAPSYLCPRNPMLHKRGIILRKRHVNLHKRKSDIGASFIENHFLQVSLTVMRRNALQIIASPTLQCGVFVGIALNPVFCCVRLFMKICFAKEQKMTGAFI